MMMMICYKLTREPEDYTRTEYKIWVKKLKKTILETDVDGSKILK
jgi:hypothetical protein